MLDPMIGTSFLIEVGKWAISELAERWQVRAKASEEKYAQRVASGEADLLKKDRIERITRARNLYNETLSHVAPPQRDRLIAIFQEARAKTYEARTDVQLEEITISLDYLDSRIKKVRQQNRLRGYARWVASLFSLALLVFFVICVYLTVRGDLSKEDLSAGAFEKITMLGIPASIIVWSIIGSIVAIPMQFNKYVNAEEQDMLRWAITRPATGIVMGIILYLVVKAGLDFVTLTGRDGTFTREATWLIALIGGLMAPVGDIVLTGIVNRLSGNSVNEEILKAVAQARIFRDEQALENSTFQLASPSQVLANPSVNTSPTIQNAQMATSPINVFESIPQKPDENSGSTSSGDTSSSAG